MPLKLRFTPKKKNTDHGDQTSIWRKKKCRKNQCFFFGRETQFQWREKSSIFLNFCPWKKYTPVKKLKKPSKSARENHFLPVKIFENYTRENQIIAREKLSKKTPLKRQKIRKNLKMLPVKQFFLPVKKNEKVPVKKNYAREKT